MKDVLCFDPITCVDCHICELVCSFVNNGGFNPRYSFIKISVNEDTGFTTVDLSRECTLCLSCENNCPTKALRFSSNPENCSGESGIGIFIQRGGVSR